MVLPIFSHLPKDRITLVLGLAPSISPNWEFCFFEGFPVSFQLNFTLLGSPIPVLAMAVSGRFGPEHHAEAKGSNLPCFCKEKNIKSWGEWSHFLLIKNKNP